MAQDETYDTTVYLERGGDRLVAGSGGTIAIESGGSALFQDSATLTLLSGADMSVISGATFGLAGGDLLGDDARRILVSELGDTVVIIPSALSVKLTGRNNLPKNARMVTVVGSTAMSKGSFYLTSCSAGREVFLRLVGDVSGGFTNNNTSLAIITSGCIILNSLGGAQASFTMHTSAASDCGVILKAVLDNTWAIVKEIGSNIVES